MYIYILNAESTSSGEPPAWIRRVFSEGRAPLRSARPWIDSWVSSAAVRRPLYHSLKALEKNINILYIYIYMYVSMKRMSSSQQRHNHTHSFCARSVVGASLSCPLWLVPTRLDQSICLSGQDQVCQVEFPPSAARLARPGNTVQGSRTTHRIRSRDYGWAVCEINRKT